MMFEAPIQINIQFVYSIRKAKLNLDKKFTYYKLSNTVLIHILRLYLNITINIYASDESIHKSQ